MVILFPWLLWRTRALFERLYRMASRWVYFQCYRNDSENAGFYAISDLNTDTESDVKILGNIYDNPYLIKEE